MSEKEMILELPPCGTPFLKTAKEQIDGLASYVKAFPADRHRVFGNESEKSKGSI